MLQVFVIIVIQFQAIFYKTQRADRSNEIFSIKFFYAAKGRDELINKLRREFSLRFKAMVNTAKFLQLFWRGEINARCPGTKAAGINTKDQMSWTRIVIKLIKESFNHLHHFLVCLRKQDINSFG